MVKMLILGAPRGIHENRWKNDIAEDGARLGWKVWHWPAKNVPVEYVIEKVRKERIDILMWARTHKHNPWGDYHMMLRECESLGAHTVGLHMDLYWGIPHREKQVGVDAFWTCQYVYTADGGHPDNFAKRGVNHRWCPPAVGKSVVGRGTVDPMWANTVTFVGGALPCHGKHRAEMIRWAKTGGLRGHEFKWRGNNKEPIWGPRLSDYYSSCKGVLGDSVDSPRYWSDRIPQTLARGGLLYYPNTVGLAEQGFSNSTMVLFDRFDFRRIQRSLDGMSDVQRKEITDCAMDLINDRHLWMHRLSSIAQEVLR